MIYSFMRFPVMNHDTRFLEDPGLRLNRRHFFSRTSVGLGTAALAGLLGDNSARGKWPAPMSPDAIPRPSTLRTEGCSPRPIIRPRQSG